jgi:hypothetical protein
MLDYVQDQMHPVGREVKKYSEERVRKADYRLLIATQSGAKNTIMI